MAGGVTVLDQPRGLISTSNSTTTALTGGATFTGTAEQNFFPDVMASCYADVAGTLYFDFSINGTDWRTFPSSGFVVSAGIHEFHTAVKGPRYFRIRFVNGAAAQSTFQLQTYYGTFRQPNAPMNQPLGLDSDALLVRSSQPWLDVSRGLFSGIEVIKKFGRNDAIGTSFTPVTNGGVYQTPQSGSATTLRIASGGNANDTAAGSGARSVTLQGLDEDFNYVSETIATAGASASSATTATFTRLYRAFVATSGTYATASTGSHSADITIENGSGGTTWAIISDDLGFPNAQSEIGAYSVPTGYTAHVFLDNIVVDTNKATDVVFFKRDNIDQTAAPYSAMRAQVVLAGVVDNASNRTGRQVLLGPFTGPCDIGWLAKVDSTTASVSVEFEIHLVQE